MNADRKMYYHRRTDGAGKTHLFALEHLPHEAECPAFVNADLIAALSVPLSCRKGDPFFALAG